MNLRASDDMQLELQDKFRVELDGLLYERQQKLFSSLSEDELTELGYDPSQTRGIEIEKLAKTFLAAQGEVDRMSRLNDVFETEGQYRACFADRYLKSDAHRILVAYKIQFRLKKVADGIKDSVQGRDYEYVPRAKNLLWALLVQGVLNHPELDDIVAAHGNGLRVDADFTNNLLVPLGVAKVRHVIRAAATDPKYKEQLDEDRLDFLRTKAFYSRCMVVADERYGWAKRAL